MAIDEVIKKLEKQPRIPRNYESIEKGALELELKDRIRLRNALVASIDKSVKELKEELDEVDKLFNNK